MKIIYITPDHALSVWPSLSVYLQKAIDQGQNESTLADYMRKILLNTAQCWGVFKGDSLVGVGMTEILQYAQHKTLHIIAFSGDNFDEQAEVFPTIVEYAKAYGCQSIEQWGRKGWARSLPRYIPEFKEVYTVMRYDL